MSSSVIQPARPVVICPITPEQEVRFERSPVRVPGVEILVLDNPYFGYDDVVAL